MATNLKEVDAVLLGVGLVGSIIGRELVRAGLNVVGLERGAPRHTVPDFQGPHMHDELRYAVRKSLMMNTAKETFTFRNNTAGTWSNSFFSGEGAANSVVDGVTITGNTVTGGSLMTIVRLSTGRRNITITNNTSRVTARGPVLLLSYIAGLTVTVTLQPSPVPRPSLTLAMI